MTPQMGWRIVLSTAVVFAVVAVAMDRRAEPPELVPFDQRLADPSQEPAP